MLRAGHGEAARIPARAGEVSLSQHRCHSARGPACAEKKSTNPAEAGKPPSRRLKRHLGLLGLIDASGRRPRRLAAPYLARARKAARMAENSGETFPLPPGALQAAAGEGHAHGSPGRQPAAPFVLWLFALSHDTNGRPVIIWRFCEAGRSLPRRPTFAPTVARALCQPLRRGATPSPDGATFHCRRGGSACQSYGCAGEDGDHSRRDARSVARQSG